MGGTGGAAGAESHAEAGELQDGIRGVPDGTGKAEPIPPDLCKLGRGGAEAVRRNTLGMAVCQRTEQRDFTRCIRSNDPASAEQGLQVFFRRADNASHPGEHLR